MNSGRLLKGGMSAADTAQRVVLRAPPHASPAEPPLAGIWITEQALEALKHQWLDQGRQQGRDAALREAQEIAHEKAGADAKAVLERELKARDEKTAKEQGEKWRSLATALADQLQMLRDQLESEVSEWTYVAATRLLGQQAREDVASVVRHVLAEAELEGPVTVLLNSQDLAVVEATRSADVGAWPAGLSFAASDRIALGGCLVQSPAQTIDARLEVQLALLRQALDISRRESAEPEA